MTESEARRWIREVHGKTGIRTEYLNRCLDAMIAGRELPDPDTSGRWMSGARESRLETLERLLREEER